MVREGRLFLRENLAETRLPPSRTPINFQSIFAHSVSLSAVIPSEKSSFSTIVTIRSPLRVFQ